MSAGSNKFGSLFQFTTFGESHGAAMGVVIDGCPAGLNFDENLLLEKLKRRRPGQVGTTTRAELDQPEILSGVFEGKTLGTPIALVVRNQNQKSADYDKIKDEARIGHADDLWQNKFGHRDHRGGGRASARETLNWVMAGAVAQMLVQSEQGTEVIARLEQVGDLKVTDPQSEELQEMLGKAKKEGESYGALVDLKVSQPPSLVGEPVFKKLKAEMVQAFMSINACTAVELGGGFAMAIAKGTEIHNEMNSRLYGGSRGGISTGEDLHFRLAFKPTSSIKDTAKQGRHDPCVALRALPVVEAMAWSVLADLLLAKRLN